MTISTAVGTVDTGVWVGVRVDDIGAATTPPAESPLTTPHADWLYWRRLPDVRETVAVAATSSTSYQIDIKSRRRLHEIGDTFWLVLDPNTVAHSIVTSASLLLALA